VRQIEEETKRDADRRVRNILAVCMQRMAAGHAAETTVSVVPAHGGRHEGPHHRSRGPQHPRARAPDRASTSSSTTRPTRDPLRLRRRAPRDRPHDASRSCSQDGPDPPARIEETYYQAKSSSRATSRRSASRPAFDANVQGIDPELAAILGRLKYRTSYGQNVLAHSSNVRHLSAMMAHELGASATTARRAALLHDIGKAVSHEIEGPHALVGGDLARKRGESEAVAHAMEAHHNEVEPQTVEAVIVQAADALSGARPGARGESLEQYVKRLRDLEKIATRHEGVDKVYAMQAGREIRIMVAPGALDDDGATLLSHEIAREIEQQLDYPGQIKVTVIRESRATDYAR
jgi:ribonuclease Y